MKNTFKRTSWILTILFISFVFQIFGQIPPGYYDSANGLQGFTLKTALHNIIKDHNPRTYANLWTDFQSTDKKPNGKVWDMYSDNPSGTPPYEFTFVTNQCGNYNSENDCYNREHSMPASWFNDGSPMYTDLFHLYPTDGWVNNKRSNYPFGRVGSTTWTSMNGSKLGSSNYPGFTGTVFEPIDAYKGDFARTYFYMATRYQNVIANWASNSPEAGQVFVGNNTTVFKTWVVDLLLEWHEADPVSTKEINRNNAVYQIQNNRNPFIDYPEWVNYIWGGNIVHVTSITVRSENNLELISTPQGSLQMLADVLPANATNQNLQWSVENQSGTATITSTGLLAAQSNGTVLVKATATDGSGVFGTLEITISNQGTAISDNENDFSVKFSPNPVVDKLNFQFNSNMELPENIWITDISGKKLINFMPQSHRFDIDFQNYSSGIYFLNIEQKNQKSVYKILK
jgi:endonuclease I